MQVSDNVGCFFVAYRWVSSVKAEDPDYFKRLASIHTPEHLFIGCSDARLSVQSMLVSRCR